MREYFLSDGKKKFGPFSLEELKGRNINRNTLIWYKGLEKWRFAKNIPELSNLIHHKSEINYNQRNKENNSVQITRIESEKNERRKPSQNIILGVIGILFFLLIAILFFKNWNYDKLGKTNSSNAEVSFNEKYHLETIKNLIKAEDKRDFEKVYSFYAKPIVRYWDLSYPDSTRLRKKYFYAWGLTSSSSNQIDTILKIAVNTYDLFTNFTYYNLKKQNYSSSKSRIRFVFNDKGKIEKVFNIKISNDNYDIITGEPKKTTQIQKKKIYFNSDWEVTTFDNHTYYRIVTLDKEGIPKSKVKDYYKTGELQWEGELLQIKGFNARTDVINGLCTWYDKDGNIIKESNYQNGQLNGVSSEYDNNGKLVRMDFFSDGYLKENLYPFEDTEKQNPGNEFSNTKVNEAKKRKDLTEEEQFTTYLISEGSLREMPSVAGETIKIIEKYEYVTILNYENNYWKVRHSYKVGNSYYHVDGFLNELYLKQNFKMKQIKDSIENLNK